ncbi:hypothetical protein P3T76_006480 [Phytophthora citrophthora]|uniref:Uncharacterized protein n=1 Tax=Phytophthora citrophthora TaxID=4793 RepID=A0AAD9LM55_9STRA|nr:hypothetical protein P3T76_006480 [Phytophthora citrophthora]
MLASFTLSSDLSFKRELRIGGKWLLRLTISSNLNPSRPPLKEAASNGKDQIPNIGSLEDLDQEPGTRTKARELAYGPDQVPEV